MHLATEAFAKDLHMVGAANSSDYYIALDGTKRERGSKFRRDQDN